MGFATDRTAEEAAFGFEVLEHVAHGAIVMAPIGNGLRAVKLRVDDGVRYAICDDALIMLYEPARSIAELRRRFGSGVRRAG